jgi:pimeloyl-ACP methyl ester carboxylesterase
MNYSSTVIPGSKDKPISLDVFINSKKEKRPVVVFCHGYKGFKDWGAWNVMGEVIANSEFNLVKFNFSYNGTTIQKPIDFDDLEAFGNNNYITELNDLEKVIDWVESEEGYKKYFDANEIYLIGHSRGGGIVLLKSNEDKRIKKVVTWAGVSNYFTRTPQGEKLEEWKAKGVIYERNGRTKQDMPLYYQFYKVQEANKERLNIEAAVKNIQIPMLIIHGESDVVVKLNEAEDLLKWNDKSKLCVIKKAKHTFETKHPWEEENLPDTFSEVISETLKFLK